MESIIPIGGFQLPFQRQLSRLYNDTKKSSDFVKEPVQHEDDPEIKALYRKLRIQKDRFVSWGLEWSDPSQSAEIDESLSKAGLSEVVGSIMSTIKDTLAEAEPLWLSSKRVVEGKRPSPDSKASLVQWDKDRFKDLVRDLTASIDTLYDLSRTRASGLAARASPKAASKSASGEGDFQHFESTRMQTPQQIDPKTLTHLRPVQDTSNSPAPREVVYMGKAAYSDLVRGTSSQPWAPFLLEYAPFDPIYATTGIMPPMARFERLSSVLQQDSQRAPTTWTGLPRMFAYFEDMDNSRLGLVYHFPPFFNVLAPDQSPQNPQFILPTLGDLLLQPDSEPPLEAKFRLAHHLANSVFDMHARGMTHGNLVDTNVSFCPVQTARPGIEKNEIDIRRPLLSSFEIFPDDAPPSLNQLWRYPLDSRPSMASPHPALTDERIMELYPLAMMLLSIGLWTRLEDLGLDASSPRLSERTLKLLSLRCGTLYTKAVQACLGAVEDALAGRDDSEVILSSVQMRVSRFLEACCILDGVSGLEERLGNETSAPTEIVSSTPSRPEMPVDEKLPIFKDSSSLDSKKPVAAAPTTSALSPIDHQSLDESEVSGKDTNEPKTKMRLYPHVPLPPDVVEKWNTILMPQINSALGSFYRKHPESVEISLESVGPSPHQTRPTVLVVCSSVSKVRSILNKRLGELFDDTTGFALRVCRGHVIRSRRQATAASASRPRASAEASTSSAEDADEEVEAVNPEYQERPSNGASIGAWIGDRHLPPVSFGGLVIVDDKTYGMTVHHMLDDPERDFALPGTMRSSAVPGRLPFQDNYSSTGNISEDEEEADEEDQDQDDEFGYELSDDDISEPCSETDLTSDYESDEEDEEYNEPGDIPGIEPGCGEGYIITQPAMDDVEDGFYPCSETADEDHLDTFTLGELYASSGIRRRQVDGLVHEVDWALFEFAEGRQPDCNAIPRMATEARQRSRAQRRRGRKDKDKDKDNGKDQPQLRPTSVAPWSALPGMQVQCIARTSGLQAGKILPALTSVKIYGRTSPSHAYQVVGAAAPRFRASAPLGIPGDSGAWIVDRERGQLCGHVLAWSERKQVAYICPMDVLLQDIAQTLEASEVRLPGGQPLLAICGGSPNPRSAAQGDEEEEAARASDVRAADDDDDDDDDDDAPPLAQISSSLARSLSSPRLDVGDMSRITRNLGNVSIGSRRIDVNG